MSDVPKCDLLVFDCMQQVVEIIVQSRVLQQQRVREMTSKFKLHVEELEFVRHSMEAWKSDLHMPLGIDVFWQEHQEHQRGDTAPIVELLERWEIVYEAHDSIGSKSTQRRHMNKRANILLRTLYSFVRMVPAYQVHKRIQRDFDSRERSPGVERDDMGFCLYPILDRGGGGSGLSFSTVPSNSDDGGCRIDRKMSTGCYSFKPLEAPHGSMRITVTYRRGVDPKARRRRENLGCPTSTMAPNMTTSIIQDYVPDKYSNDPTRQIGTESDSKLGGEVDGDKQIEFLPKFASMADLSTIRKPQVSEHEHGTNAMSGLGAALLHHNVDGRSGVQGRVQAYSLLGYRPGPDKGTDSFGETDLALGPGLLHWPSPEQGHGYADSRVYKLKGQGLAPFLTPGPHRHKLVPSGNQGHVGEMEPLDLGPTAGVRSRDRQRPADLLLLSSERSRCRAHAEEDRHNVNSREPQYVLSGGDSIGAAQSESRSLDTHGSLEEYVGQRGRVQSLHRGCKLVPDVPPDTILPTTGLEQQTNAPLRSVYRRNSISEEPMGVATVLPHEQALLSVMKDNSQQSKREGATTGATSGPTGSTPPFSYYEDVSTARRAEANADEPPFELGHPLVSFSPPFDASPLTPGVHDQLPRAEGGELGDASPIRAVQAQSGTEVRCHGALTSFALAASFSPALLETLPESPFSSSVGTERSIHPAVSATATATSSRFSTPFALPILEGRSVSAPGNADQRTATAMQVIDSAEGLPFAVYGDGGMREDIPDFIPEDSGVVSTECGSNITRSVPPSTLFALYSATSSKSMFLAKEGPPPELRTPAPCSSFDDGTTPVENGKEIDPTTAYSPSGRRLELMELAQETEKTVRSLEEELDGFRQFHEELGSVTRP